MSSDRTRTLQVILAIVAVSILSVGMWLARGGREDSEDAGGRVSETENRPPELSGPDIKAEFMFPPGAATGSIAGRVLDPAGKPVPGAIVSIGPRLVGRAKFREWLQRANPQMVRSDERGAYRVEGVKPGVLALSASAAPYIPGRREPVKLLPGEALAGVDITLENGGVRLFGTVSDSGGGPIAGALVTVAGFEWEKNDDDASALIVQTLAGDDGRYELYLKPLWYDVRASADGYAADQSWASVKTETRHDVRLHPAARITGTIRDAKGQAVADAVVRVVQARGFSYKEPEEHRTDEQGRYQSEALDPGSYSVEARFGELAVRSKEPVAVALAQTVTVDLTLQRGHVIAGRVTDSGGKPIAGARIFHDDRFFSMFGGDKVDVTSDKDGRYVAKGLLGPMVRLTCEAEGRGVQVWSDQALRGDRKDVNFVLADAARLVILALDPEGRPMRGVMGGALVGDRRAFETLVIREAEKASGDDGRLTIANLPAGKAEVSVHAMEFGSQREPDVEIRAGEEKQLTIRFQVIATVKGVVQWDDGRGAAGVQVFASGRSSGNGTVTKDDGSFEIEKLAPGDYTLMAMANEKDEFAIRRKPDARSQARVSLKAGDRRDGVKLTLQRRDLAIEGIVIGPDGRPVAGAQVGVTTTNGARFGDCAVAYQGKVLSDDTGHFKLDNLPKGLYGVCATQAGFANTTVENVAAGTQGLQVRLQAPGRISGVVIDAAGKPLAEGAIVATHRPPEENGSALAPWKTAPRTQEIAGGTGAFTFAELRPGVYDLMASAAGGAKGMLRNVRVDEGKEVAGVRVSIQGGVTLTGRVVHGETRKPLAGVRVTAWVLKENASSDAEGRFRLNNVPAGMKVALHLQPAPADGLLPDAFEAWMPADGKDLDVGTLTLSPGRPEDMMGMSGHASSGLRVRHEGGHPVVTGIYEESPAASSGVKVRDRVLSINGRSVSELGQFALEKLLEGEDGQSVKVRVQTGDGPEREVTIGLARF